LINQITRDSIISQSFTKTLTIFNSAERDSDINILGERNSNIVNTTPISSIIDEEG
jgi:hypothetical protein